MAAMELEANTTYTGTLVSRDKVETYDINHDYEKCPQVTGIIALIETDGVTVGIKGFAWDVPELALLELGSEVKFEINEDGCVSSMELA